MPRLLVRAVRDAAPDTGLDAAAFLADRRGRPGRRVPRGVTLPAVRRAATPRARPPAQHAVHLLALRRRPRPFHAVRRFPAREGLHQAALAAAARRAARERADDPLRELRRADRPREGLDLQPLRRRAVDAGYEEDGGDREPARTAGAGAAAAARACAGELDRSWTARRGKMVGVEIWNGN